MTRLILPVILLLASCANKKEVPENILPPEKMEAITWDLIRADGLLTYTIPADTTFPPLDKRTQTYHQVLQVHGVDRKAYQRSLKFYESRPDLLRIVFEKMQERTKQLPDSSKGRVVKDTL